VSIKRITGFLQCEEMNENMISYQPKNEEERHLDVKRSNYFWGFPNMEEDEFDKEKKKV
jgi:hypothetical protein